MGLIKITLGMSLIMLVILNTSNSEKTSTNKYVLAKNRTSIKSKEKRFTPCTDFVFSKSLGNMDNNLIVHYQPDTCTSDLLLTKRRRRIKEQETCKREQSQNQNEKKEKGEWKKRIKKDKNEEKSRTNFESINIRDKRSLIKKQGFIFGDIKQNYIDELSLIRLQQELLNKMLIISSSAAKYIERTKWKEDEMEELIRKMKEEGERKAKERERKEREERERKAKEERERKEREERERKAKEERERKEREERVRKAKEEQERKAKEERERKEREERERKAKEEQERKEREERERKAKEEQERKEKEERERKARVERERKEREEQERKAKVEQERKEREERERKAKEEQERKEREERERKEKVERERKAKEEQERKAKVERERKEREERERIARVERERKEREEQERKEKVERERKEREERERKAREEEEKKRKRLETTTMPSTTTALAPTSTTESNDSRSGGLGLLLGGIAGGLLSIVFALKGTLLVLVTQILPAVTGLLLLLPKPGPPGGGGGSGNNYDNDGDDNNNDDDDDDNKSDESKENSEEEKKKKKKKKEKSYPCKLNIKRIGSNYPLILSPSEHSQFLYPQNRATINLNPKDKVTFGCHRPETYVCKNRTITKELSGTTEYDIYSMSCSTLPQPVIKLTDGSFGNKRQYTKYRIGLSYGLANFVPIIQVYYSPKSEMTAFARTTLSHAMAVKQKSPTKQKLSSTFCCGSKNLPEDLYTIKSQRKTFDTLFNCHGNATEEKPCTYLDNNNYLVPTLLIPETYFVYTQAGTTSFYYINTAPMWNNIKNGNWAKIEAHVLEMAKRLKKDLVVVSGVYEHLRLVDSLDGITRGTRAFLKYDKERCNGEFPIPLFFWKLVYDPSSNSGIVFVTVNDPYITNGKNYLICEKPGHYVKGESPAGWNPESIKQGYSYMCTIEDFIFTTEIDLVNRLDII